MLEVKSVPNLLGTPVSYAYAVKAGPWIFLNGHEAFDFESGIPEEVAGPASFPLFGRPRGRREGDFVLRRMRRILREFGSDLSHSVRLDQYYPNPRAVAAYHLARHAEFGDYIPPSTSVVMERCFSTDATISSSLIAVVPSAEYEIRKIHPAGVAAAPTSGFVPTVVCDEFVFVAGQMAHNPGQGLDPRAHRVFQIQDFDQPEPLQGLLQRAQDPDASAELGFGDFLDTAEQMAQRQDCRRENQDTDQRQDRLLRDHDDHESDERERIATKRVDD